MIRKNVRNKQASKQRARAGGISGKGSVTTRACKPHLNFNHNVLVLVKMEATDLSISRSQRDQGVKP